MKVAGWVLVAAASLALRGGAGAQAPGKPCVTLVQAPDDAVTAAPANHTVLFEDADVRVLDVHSKPHTREAVHTHRLPAVMYFEQQGAGDYDTADGSVHRSHPTDPNFKPEVRAIKPEGPHYTTNTGDVPFHAVRVEFKHPGCGLPGWQPAKPGSDDALRAAPGTHTLLFENDEVRVLDVHLAAHAQDAMHNHPWPGIFYIVQAEPVRDVLPTAAGAQVVSFPAGSRIMRAETETHAFQNAGDGPLHLIWFELKYGSAH